MHVYLDYNATAPLRAEARAAMIDAMDATGNPSSVHAAGRLAKSKLERSRQSIARALGAAAGDVVFTGGGTEANNLGLIGLARANACTHILLSSVEHACIRVAARTLNLPLETLPVTPNGVLDLAVLKTALSALPDGAKPLLCLMLANNETGVIQPVQEASQMLRAVGGFVHVDAVQGFGKIPVNLAQIGADTMAVSAHKIGGPLGVGALALACGTKLEANAYGGGQEFGRRGGTENVPGIAGFAAASGAAIADLDHLQAIEQLRDHLQQSLLALAPGAQVVGANAPRLGNTLCIATPGFSAETQLMAMDLAGFAISSGSACSSGKVKASVVMLAMHLPDDLAANTIRISLGRTSTMEEMDAFANAWGDAYGRKLANEAA